MYIGARNHVVAGALILILICACATSGRRQVVDLITVDEEIRIGNLIALEIAQQYPLISDDEINDYLTTLGESIAAQSDWSGLEYHFRVINTDEVNSFSIPGGHVYLHRGLLDRAQSLSEVACMLAHEIAHIASRHGTEELTVRYGLALEAHALLGENPELWKQMAADLFTVNSLLNYGYKEEFAADALAITYAQRAGYDPRGLESFLRRLAGEEKELPLYLYKMYLTHPEAKKRLPRVRKGIEGLPLRLDLINDDAEFDVIQAKIRTIPAGRPR